MSGIWDRIWNWLKSVEWSFVFVMAVYITLGILVMWLNILEINARHEEDAKKSSDKFYVVRYDEEDRNTWNAAVIRLLAGENDE